MSPNPPYESEVANAGDQVGSGLHNTKEDQQEFPEQSENLCLNLLEKAKNRQFALYQNETTEPPDTLTSEGFVSDDEPEFPDQSGNVAEAIVDALEEEASDVDPFVGIRITFVSTKTDRKYDGVIVKSGPNWTLLRDVALIDGDETGSETNSDPPSTKTVNPVLVFTGDIKELKVLNLRNEEIPQSPQLLFSEAVKTKVVVEPKAEMFPQFEGFPEEQKVSTWTLSMPKVRPNKKTGVMGFPYYEVPQMVAKIIDHQIYKWKDMDEEEAAALDVIQKLLKEGLTIYNYKDYLCFLLYAEEHRLNQQILEFDMLGIQLQLHYNLTKNHVIVVPGVIDKSPNVIKRDTIYIRRPGSDDEFEMSVEDVLGDKIFLRPVQESDFSSKFLIGKTFGSVACNVAFTVNRSTLKSMHRSLAMLESHIIERFFPAWAHVPDSPSSAPEYFQLFNKSIASNHEQFQAVVQILAGSSKKFPYILFGPPGTGKTVTIVESIKQVWKNIPDSRIIVATPSNSAADLVSDRLLADVPQDQLIRLYAVSRLDSVLPAELDDVSVFGNIELKKIDKCRIVCLTLAMCSHLHNLKKKPGFFTHIFIDEAGQCTEPELLIGLAGLISEQSQIILSGDPYQLGPVVVSATASRLGLSTSPMERLMNNFCLYQRDNNGNRNPAVITKLCKNFRSHKALLEIPSQIFYEDELKACADEDTVHQLAQLDFLPKKGFPLFVHGIQAKHQRDPKCPSLFNTSEADVVKHYVKLLLNKGIPQTSIGIISPYRRQVRLIRQRLQSLIGEDKLLGILVGSTEEFQGQERLVMIISTVRSTLTESGTVSMDMGFLSHPKRFNVAITRAQALQILVCDPFLLHKDRCWNSLLMYCIKEGAMKGLHFTPEVARAFYSKNSPQTKNINNTKKKRPVLRFRN